MFRGIEVLPEADADVIGAAAWIGRRSRRAARRFVEAFFDTVGQIGERPHLGREVALQHPRLRPMRSQAIRGFSSYLVFYEVTPEHIVVVRVLHGARDLPELLD